MNRKLMVIRLLIIFYGLAWMFVALYWFRNGQDTVLDWQLFAMMFGGGSMMILAFWFSGYERKVEREEYYRKYPNLRQLYEEKNALSKDDPPREEIKET